MMNHLEIIKKVADSVSLESIFLKSSNADVSLPPGAISPDTTTVDINYSFSHVFDPESKVLFSFVAADLNGTLSAEAKASYPELAVEDDRLFKCSCVFVVKYLSKIEISSEEGEVFTKNNALFNTYPFLREHIASEFSKMGIPGIFLPLLKRSEQEG